MNNNKLLIVTHGTLGVSMIEVARKIIGENNEGNIFFVSNDNLSTIEITERISEITDKYPDSFFLIITDFPGGSCFIASKKIASSSKRISSLSGLNISMVLSFLTKREMFTGAKLAEVVKTDGNRAIVS
jgi:mannose/fructose-specific phosphotransferase system component IIA